jgi:hypothetical protein
LAEWLIESMKPDMVAGRQAMRLAPQPVVALAAAASARPARPTSGAGEALRAALGSPCRLCGDGRPFFLVAFAPASEERWPSDPGKVMTRLAAVCGACASTPGLEPRLAEALLGDWQQGPSWTPEDN